jgi:NitT/TauT family transport system ATP-binding protein
MAQVMTDYVLEARGIVKYYDDAKHPILVLDHVDLAVRRGEFMAILGPSGSGKSSLLRILAGLSQPTQGEVWFDGRRQTGVNPHAAMVFQSFALFPWLTVQENVELGLEAQHLPAAERRERALRAIDLIGLDGFETAYPKELSGGMRQRVGFARALVVEPRILMMDEPFSALDVLTASNLREELLDLWLEKKMPFQAIVMVTHNIDEAVLMADRIVVLGHDPGRVRANLEAALPRPRDVKGEQEQALVDRIYRLLTHPEEEYPPVVHVPPAVPTQRPHITLPHAPIGSVNGLTELVANRGGREDLYDLGRDLQMEIDDLLPLVEAAELLDLARVTEGDIELTERGRQLAEGSIQEDKALFRQQILARVAPIREIVERLEAEESHKVNWDELHEEWQHFFSAEEAEDQLETAIDWGRYAELFAYDEDSGNLFLETPEP